ncbi:MAG TPA: winged helix-turn-helix domain-containing protein [Candidatus Saccharimonadales bacterium]|nr:winged helix-turn-helix domain-containing protein [Candidatus Saccharimonadales bacterium]
MQLRKWIPVSKEPHTLIPFGPFEADLPSQELRKLGVRLRLPKQSFQILKVLLDHPGELVSREELRQILWPADTFVDFEHGLNAAVNRLRDALGDDAESPCYIETLPKRGYRFIGKMKAAPRVVLAASETLASVELAPVRAAKAWPSRNRILGLAAVAAVVVAGILFAWSSGKFVNSKLDFQPMTAVPFTSYPGRETTPSFSPDGSRIAFSWDNGTSSTGKLGYNLYVKAIGSETVLQLTNHPSDWISSTWSPDGSQIAFHRLAGDDTGIYVVPALGGPERKLVSTHAPHGVAAPLSWSPDGKWIAYADTESGQPGNRAFLLNVATLESHKFPHDPSCQHEEFLTFSHSGQDLAIVCNHNTIGFEVMVTNLEGKSRRSLTTFSRFILGLAWSADDQSLIVSEEVLDGADGSEFDEIRVHGGDVHKLSVTAGSWQAISDDGHKLAFSKVETHLGIWRKDLQNSEAPAVQMYDSTRPQNNSQYSPDGQHVAFDSDRSGTWSVWVAEIDGSNLVQISHGEPAGFPRWSPDSKKIAFSTRDPDGLESVYTADLSDRVARKLRTNIRQQSIPYWSHDGKWIYFLGYEGNSHQLYRCPAGGGDATLLVGSLELTMAIESADGKVLYFSSRFIDANIMMLALDRPGATPQAIPQMAKIFTAAHWAVVPAGIYFSPHDNPRSVCFYDFATKHTRETFRADKDLNEGMSVSPDGRYMLYSQMDESNADIMLVNHFR